MEPALFRMVSSQFVSMFSKQEMQILPLIPCRFHLLAKMTAWKLEKF
jgi:hypothetical protein